MNILKLAALTFVLLSLQACSEKPVALRTEEELKELENLPFRTFLDQSYFAMLRTYPELVTELGMDGELGMSGEDLDSFSEEYLLEREKLESGILSLLLTYGENELNGDERISYAVYRAYLEDLVRGHEYRRHKYLLSYMISSVNVATEQFFTEIIPVRNAGEAEKYIARLRAVLPKMEEVDRQMAIQEDLGIILAAPLLQASLQSVLSVSGSRPADTAFYKNFAEKLNRIDLEPDRKEDLLSQAEKACETSVLPGYSLLEKRLRSQRGKAPGRTGVGSLPGGGDYYNYAIAHYTNSDMTAEAIHGRGLEELEEIHKMMRETFSLINYDIGQSIPRLYARLENEDKTLSGSRIVETHRDLIDSAVLWMRPYFNSFPRSEALVKEDSRGGFYIPPSFDGSRPGTFYASTGSVSYFTLPTLTFHETYPGHHYQIALAGEMELPFFRRQAMFTGYLEGWALYAEYLMAESGYYEKDPQGRLGYLQARAFRAARLVVDTGLHLYGWDMNKAISFFSDNTGFNRGFAANQIYRYLVWPGQAASYYTGFLEFKNLLNREKEAKGENFDYGNFHDRLLSNGPMPLVLLKNEIFGELK